VSDKCLLRIEDLLKKSSIRSTQKDEILAAIKTAQQEMNISKIDEINVDKVAQEVTEQKKTIQKPLKAHAWDTIGECADKASIEDLTVALARYMDRVQDIADKQKETLNE